MSAQRLLAFATALWLCVAVALPAAADAQRRIAIMCAFGPELTALEALMEDRSDEVVHGVRFAAGTIEGVPVVLFQSGFGMVNAAMTAQMALSNYDVEGIVFSGIAGGVDPSLNIGDVLVADQWASHFNVALARDDPDGIHIPPILKQSQPAFGMIVPIYEQVWAGGAETPTLRSWFPVDATYMDHARRAAEMVSLAECGADGTCLSSAPRIVLGGNGVSGSAFVDNADYREHLASAFDARVADMESAAVAQVATTNEVPFIAFRSLSDLAGGSDSANEIGTFMSVAAGNSAALVRAFLAEVAAAR